MAWCAWWLWACFFFFQAEDGIRDSSVTGVQTCALPICAAGPRTPRRPDGSDFDHVYLSDFGVSKISVPGENAAMGPFAGTLDYVAPQQIEGRPRDGRADPHPPARARFRRPRRTPPLPPR